MHDNKWLSITDYSNFKNVSISTIRRRIRAGKVVYRMDDGKYLIYTDDYVATEEPVAIKKESEILELKLETQRLKLALQKKQEELDELKMLISIYEQNEENKNSSMRLVSNQEIEPPALPLA